MKDKERLADLQEKIQAEQVRYEPARDINLTVKEIGDMGQRTLTGKMAVSKDDYQKLTALATEGITSRSEIHELNRSVEYTVSDTTAKPTLTVGLRKDSAS